jgi:hypothetical protein
VSVVHLRDVFAATEGERVSNGPSSEDRASSDSKIKIWNREFNCAGLRT